CADRARRLRIQQCREGWHREDEPLPPADPATPGQIALMIERADITTARDELRDLGDTLSAVAAQEALDDVDTHLRRTGIRGTIEPPTRGRRVRSTRRRQDAPDLPRCPRASTTLGRTYVDARTGHSFRPSLFLTVTLPSYGRVRSDGTPVDPDTYDYARAARDARHFAKLLDRLVQNLRRVAGYDLQYFAVVEPQRRLAPHAHFALRGTLPRALIRRVLRATYHQVWWPRLGPAVYGPDRTPLWDPTSGPDGQGGFVDPDTRTPLPTWDQALDALGDDATPAHVIRFGDQHDVQGLLAGSPQADRRIGYLTKYLTKSMGGAHENPTPTQRAHARRLAEVLAVEPCSPSCPCWLRHGLQPRGARPDQTPDSCRSRAHRPEHLGYPGRRILVSRQWSGKTLTDHRADRRRHVLATLGLDPDDIGDKTRDRYHWEHARPDHLPPLGHRLLRAIAQRHRWRATYQATRNHPPPSHGEPPERTQLSGTGSATCAPSESGVA
ncbi:MAG: hypothetical protein QG608_534, partial [Actinomycetota bacterium]|nr:hypothetical protein [Actinomycetota bacterium]